jgi:hypothetical protein
MSLHKSTPTTSYSRSLTRLRGYEVGYHVSMMRPDKTGFIAARTTKRGGSAADVCCRVSILQRY